MPKPQDLYETRQATLADAKGLATLMADCFRHDSALTNTAEKITVKRVENAIGSDAVEIYILFEKATGKIVAASHLQRGAGRYRLDSGKTIVCDVIPMVATDPSKSAKQRLNLFLQLALYCRVLQREGKLLDYLWIHGISACGGATIARDHLKMSERRRAGRSSWVARWDDVLARVEAVVASG